MKEHKMSRRNFLKVGAVASAAGLMTAAPVAANAAAPAASTAADEENCFGLFQKKPKYIFLLIGDGMGTARDPVCPVYQGTVTNNGAITEAELSFTQFPEVGSVTTYDSTFCRTPLPLPPPSLPAKRPRAVSSICAPGPVMCPMRPLQRSSTSRKATRLASFPR